MKKTILVDLDGVLNTYNGNYDETHIQSAKEGVEKFLAALSESFIVKIFTTRPENLASEWIKSNNIENYISGITNKKEPAYLIIDDRCITFDGDYKNTLKKIKNFKVWYRK